MEEPMSARVPAQVFSPGEFIREELDARGWTQGDLAQIMDRPLRLVNELVAGKKQITPDTARGLSSAFGDDDPLYWMSLDSAYRLAQAKPADKAVVRRSHLYSKFPVREMVKRHWIEASDDMDVVEHRVCRFFGIARLDDTPAFLHAAKAAQYDERTPIQWAWLFRAKQLAADVQSVAYSEVKLRSCLTKLREMLASPQDARQIPDLLVKAGVKLVLVEFLPGAKIDGAVFWLDDQQPVIAMALRFDRFDNFWFVLRHEIEHILRKDGLVTLDLELTERTQQDVQLPEAEIRANAAAAEFLVPGAALESFMTRVRPLYSEQNILLFAERIAVHPSLVIGQLQRRKEIPYARFQKYVVKIRDIITQTALTDGWGHAPAGSDQTGETDAQFE